MEHSSSTEELQIMSNVDFIVPLKQVGIITRAVLEAIQLFYRPRRIIVVTSRKEGEILNGLVGRWNVQNCSAMPEEDFFLPNLGLKFSDIIAEYDYSREGDKREPGWWIQQLIKLGAATQIPNISPVYIVWDGDLVPNRRWRLCDLDESGNARFHIAILQGESRSEFNSSQYAGCMLALTGMEPVEPDQGGTFVAHHMTFSVKRVKEMLELMAETTGCQNTPWPKLIMAHSRKFYRFSEYKTYATFMRRYYPGEFNYHPLSQFGEGGLRFREANTMIDEILTRCPVQNGGIRYSDLKDFVDAKWQLLPGASKVIPAYIQLDHVYGLDGIDLNMSEESEKVTTPKKFPIITLSSSSSIKNSQYPSPNSIISMVNENSPNRSSPLRTMFNDPIAVVNEDAKNLPRDDSCIRRMNMKTSFDNPFASTQISSRTMPRRPSNKTYLCASNIMFGRPVIDESPLLQVKTPWVRAL